MLRKTPNSDVEQDLLLPKKKLWIFRLKLSLVLFISLEILLRLFGFKAGTLLDDFKFEDHPVYQKRFISDEYGINHLVYDKETFIPGFIPNGQGFRGRIEYTNPAQIPFEKIRISRLLW